MTTFNKEQQAAIDNPVKENLLLSAGAGSGKTKTLSYKVYKLVCEDHLDPSEILVLTFTDKAAFEMKERILKEFRKHSSTTSTEKRLEDEILSSHIQTFDSFSMYLAKKYASYLGISDCISIMNENVESSKEKEFLDEILHDYYQNDKARILSSFSKFNTQDDSESKKMILAINFELNKLLESHKESFMSDYESHYLTKAFFDDNWDNLVDTYRKDMEKSFKKAFFAYTHSSLDEDVLAKLLLDEKNLASISVLKVGHPNIDPLLDDYQRLLTCPKKEFFINLDQLKKDPRDLLNKSRNFKKDEKEFQLLYKALKETFTNDKEGLFIRSIEADKDYQTQYNLFLSFKEDIKLIFEIIRKLDMKLRQYKETTGTYTFSDVSALAIRLLTDEKCRQAGKEIKKRFKYILVDEYQDTNDIQETFLEEITCHGTGATLFCVGDAKQAIYRFRNSNVQLFLDRKEAYLKKQKQGNVIEMNNNYRSYPKLIEDINTIFEKYMSKDHGGIDYIHKDRLDYDKSLPPRLEDPKSDYGLHLLTYEPLLDESPVLSEARTIALDIQNKVHSHYKILREINGKMVLDNCKYSDFSILIKRKRSFTDYQTIFNSYGIPLNNQLEDHLSDINAILLLQSLVAFVDYESSTAEEKKNSFENLPHLFMSLARSYIYGKEEGYTDEKIYDLVQSGNYLTDRILKEVQAFSFKHRDSPFSIIYLDLLSTFKVLEKLPSVGSINDNLAKIESLYRILLSQEASGEGIKDFVKLFKNINKYQIEITTTTVSESENAVALMTTHKSKGLEFPIVYLPITDNSLTTPPTRNRPLSLFSKEYGILLPNYQLDKKVHTILKQCYEAKEGSDREEINENVRLFYVALTRAKEACYLIGNRVVSGHKQSENLYDMLDYLCHYETLSSFYETKCKTDSTTDALLNNYGLLIQQYLKAYKAMPLLDKTPYNCYQEENFILAKELYQELVLKAIEQKMDDTLDSIAEKLIELHYSNALYNGTEDNRKLIYLKYTYSLTVTLQDYQNNPLLLNLGKYKTFLANLQSKSGNKINKSKINIRKLLNVLSYCVENNTIPFTTTVYDSGCIQQHPIVKLTKPNNGVPTTSSYPTFQVDDTPIDFNVYEKPVRASKHDAVDEDLDELAKKREQKAMDRGSHLHRLLQLTNLKTKDTTFIKDANDKAIIDKALTVSLFDDIKDASIYPEYEYLGTDKDSNGIIDCLIIKEKEILIIDYKTKNIDDPAYDLQLATYKRIIEDIFPEYKGHIKTYLLSILNATIREAN